MNIVQCDLTGKPFPPGHRTPQTHPYSYDPFPIWKAKEGEANVTIYTDRMYQNERPKYDALCKKHFGDTGQCNWDSRTPNDIEAFMKDWLKDPELKLIQIDQHCNQANGFPLWRLDVFSPKIENIS